MKSDIQGVSTCQSGQENHETFKHGGKKFVQYDYRTETGKLFSCVAPNLEIARMRLDNWLTSNPK